MEKITPQTELLDDLYELQSIRERVDVDPEPAVIGNELFSNCSVFIDYNTCTIEQSDFGGPDRTIYDGTKIVLSPLPLDYEDFSGAALRLYSSKNSLRLPNEKQVSEVEFFIGKTLSVQCIDFDNQEILGVEPQYLADIIKAPNSIKPLPQSEVDPRNIPELIEFLHIPKDPAFTLATRIFDTELANNARLIADRVGWINDNDTDEAIFYRLQISEDFGNLDNRITGFDRALSVSIKTLQSINLEVKKLGDDRTYYLRGTDFIAKTMREGIIVYAKNDKDEIIHCIPTLKTKNIINQIINNAEVFSSLT